MIIDSFAHVLPKDFAKELHTTWPSPELASVFQLDYFWDLNKRTKVLDSLNIDVQVVTLARPDIWLRAPPKLAKEFAVKANDAVAETASKSRGRLVGVGTIPIVYQGAVDEVKRCVEELGLKGIQLFTHSNGQPIDSVGYTEIFEYANNRGVPIWLHPQTWPHHVWSNQYALDRVLGWLFETSLAMCRLVLGGILDRFPNLKIVTHHLGAMMPFTDIRLEGFFRTMTMYPYAEARQLSAPPAQLLRRFYADTVVLSSSHHAFLCGLEFFGSDRVLFATDYPFGPEEGTWWARHVISTIKGAPIDDEVRRKVLGENARRLLGIA
ncbi:MAG: amidohydrolase family protein [Thaumarchaeota archaeon]|nr:amidohydrolase family protein [Candidatus Calditenuaceae archaeon]